MKKNLEKQALFEDMKNCTFKPTINKQSKIMASFADYSINSYKSFGPSRPSSADPKSKSHKAIKPPSIKSEVLLPPHQDIRQAGEQPEAAGSDRVGHQARRDQEGDREHAAVKRGPAVLQEEEVGHGAGQKPQGSEPRQGEGEAADKAIAEGVRVQGCNGRKYGQQEAGGGEKGRADMMREIDDFLRENDLGAKYEEEVSSASRRARHEELSEGSCSRGEAKELKTLLF